MSSSCFMTKVKEIHPKLTTWRRDIHKHPETGWTEFRTAALAITHLQQLGYTITMGEQAVSKAHMMGVPSADELAKHQERAIAQGADPALVAKMDGGLTGFWADLYCSEGPMLCLRFDMDSNDANEATDPEHRPVKEGYASVNPGAMHACGHDGHVAVGLALAEIVATCKDTLKGTVRFLFEPGEEGSRGAGPMAEAGAVNGVDMILGFHIGFQADTPGTIVCGTKDFLATTKSDVTFHGVSAHAGAAPEEGKNALLAACAATLNMHAIARSGKGDTRITVGKLVGGEGRNVIPPKATLYMETRGISSDLNEYMDAETKRIIKAAADMWGCTYTIETVGGTKSGTSSPELAARVADIAREMGCFDTIVEMKNFGATEDFSHLMTLVQEQGGIGTYMQIGAKLNAGHHNSYFDFDEDCLGRSLEVLAKCVWELSGK